MQKIIEIISKLKYVIIVACFVLCLVSSAINIAYRYNNELPIKSDIFNTCIFGVLVIFYLIKGFRKKKFLFIGESEKDDTYEEDDYDEEFEEYADEE